MFYAFCYLYNKILSIPRKRDIDNHFDQKTAPSLKSLYPEYPKGHYRVTIALKGGNSFWMPANNMRE